MIRSVRSPLLRRLSLFVTKNHIKHLQSKQKLTRPKQLRVQIKGVNRPFESLNFVVIHDDYIKYTAANLIYFSESYKQT